MLDIRPFRGLRFNPQRTPDLSTVVCPPYDVISADEQASLYQRSPYNIVRLELGRDEPDDDARKNRYTRASETLERWRAEQAMVQEPIPAFYLHRVCFELDGRRYERRDLIASVRLADWAEGVVLPHERTMALPKADRLKLMEATRANLSPVFALYREQSSSLSRSWEHVLQHPADEHFPDDAGTEHELWAVTEPSMVESIAAEFRAQKLYIADGHHRYETALHYRNARRAERSSQKPDAPHEFVLMLLTAADDPGLVVLPTHRMVRMGHQIALDTLTSRLGDLWNLEKVPGSHDVQKTAHATLDRMEQVRGPYAMALFGTEQREAFLITPHRPEAVSERLSGLPRALGELEVVVLHHLLIDSLIGSAEAGESILYTRDAAHAIQSVMDGQADLAFLLRPTPVRQILAVADIQERMPEKSTYFYPKPPTGLVVMDLTSTF